VSELDIVIAECPGCGMWFLSYSEEDATEKYYSHRCLTTLTDKELDKILDRAINPTGVNQLAETEAVPTYDLHIKLPAPPALPGGVGLRRYVTGVEVIPVQQRAGLRRYVTEVKVIGPE